MERLARRCAIGLQQGGERGLDGRQVASRRHRRSEDRCVAFRLRLESVADFLLDRRGGLLQFLREGLSSINQCLVNLAWGSLAAVEFDIVVRSKHLPSDDA